MDDKNELLWEVIKDCEYSRANGFRYKVSLGKISFTASIRPLGPHAFHSTWEVGHGLLMSADDAKRACQSHASAIRAACEEARNEGYGQGVSDTAFPADGKN
jgi:hypothetical protein